MTQERQKREEEIQRLMRGTGLNGQSDVAFEEEIRKAAAAVGEAEARRIQQTERPEWRKRTVVSAATVGLWLLVLGAGLAFSLPNAGAALVLCGIALMVWARSLRGRNNFLPRKRA